MLRPNVDSALTRLRAAFHDSDSREWAVVQTIVALLVVLSIGLLAAEIMWDDDRATLRELVILDDVLLWVFVVELGLRIATFAPPEQRFFLQTRWSRVRWAVIGRLRFLLRPLNLADALAVLAVIPALRGLRALRLLRLLRGVGVFRYANPFTGLARSFSDNRLPFALAFGFLSLAIVMFGTTIYMVEHTVNPSVRSLADGLWWAIVTITTVGFGDIAPVTAIGRGVAAVLMVIGMFTLALFAGIVGHTMLGVVMTIRQEEFRVSGVVNHLVVCGYDPADRRLLHELVAEVGAKYADRLVVFAAGERPHDLPSEFGWVQGDPTKESELEKVRLGHAAVAVIVGSRTVPPQVADATTILTAFTIRSLLRKSAARIPRARALYVIAEILDSENVEHAVAAGCNEVIETNRLGFSLLAHATSMPGTAAVLSEVAARGSQSAYVGALDVPGSFGDVSTRLKKELGILVVGVVEPDGKTRRINPPWSYEVQAKSRLIYFGSEPVLPLPDDTGDS